MGDEPPRPVDLAEEEGCYRALLLVRAEAVVLGGELLCHRFGDDVDVIGHLPEGTYNRHTSGFVQVCVRQLSGQLQPRGA